MRCHHWKANRICFIAAVDTSGFMQDHVSGGAPGRHTCNVLVHGDPSTPVITYDDVLGLVQVHAACDYLRHTTMFADGQASS